MKAFYSLASALCISSLTLAQSSQINPNQDISFLGSFSNMEFTPEHQYGFEAKLWKAGDTIIGHFFHSQGLIGDAPRGLIEKLLYNPKSGAISFQAKLSMGTHYCKEHDGAKSKDLYVFNGKLSENALSGVVKELDALHDNRMVKSQKVNLKKTESDGVLNLPMKTYAEWERESKRR